MSATAEPAGWSCPDAFDALVAAPSYHRLVIENDCVRVLDTRIAPGETVPVHTQRWPANVGPVELHVVNVEFKDSR